MSDQILGVLVGGAVAIVSGLFVTWSSERRNRNEWRRQARLAAAGKAIRAFQALNREITTLAISEHRVIDGTGTKWVSFHEATVEWNGARHEAALIVPEPELKLLAELDQELDRVLEAAISKQWDATDFRSERRRLGELASAYIRAARHTANEGDADAPSIWSWDLGDDEKGLRQSGPDSGRSQD